MKNTYNQIRYAQYAKDDIAVTLRQSFGDYGGGGSEVLVLQRRFSKVIVQDTEIAPTIEAGGGEGGNNLPMIVQTLVFDESQITSRQNGNHPTWGGLCHTLHGNADRAVVIIKYELSENNRDAESWSTSGQLQRTGRMEQYAGDR